MNKLYFSIVMLILALLAVPSFLKGDLIARLSIMVITVVWFLSVKEPHDWS